MIEVNSHKELLDKISKLERSYLVLHKKGTEKSDCAYKNILTAQNQVENVSIFSADVSEVKDIHPKYEITTAPTLLEFESNEFKSLIKGCHDSSYYKSLFEESIFIAEGKKDGKTIKRVTVYSTPSCSWCGVIKSYLNKNGIRYKDVDISRDPRAANDLVQRSGHTGVPQTEINGEIIVGFDREKLKQLLDIKNEVN